MTHNLPTKPKMHNQFHRPPSVTFIFRQKRFDKGGELVDEHGQVVYRFRDTGEDHTFGFVKSYVSHILHSTGDSLADHDV